MLSNFKTKKMRQIETLSLPSDSDSKLRWRIGFHGNSHDPLTHKPTNALEFHFDFYRIYSPLILRFHISQRQRFNWTRLLRLLSIHKLVLRESSLHNYRKVGHRAKPDWDPKSIQVGSTTTNVQIGSRWQKKVAWQAQTDVESWYFYYLSKNSWM